MNTHDIDTLLRQYLTGDGYIAADDIPAICAAIEADRQARGEPVAWAELHPRTGDVCDFIRKDEAYRLDEIKPEYVLPLYTTPQPQQQASEPLFWYRPIADGMYEGPVHNNSVGGKMLRDEKPGEWKPLHGAPQPQQIPEGYKLVPIDPTERMLQAAYNAVESEGLVTTTWLRNAIYRAMLEAAPEPKEKP